MKKDTIRSLLMSAIILVAMSVLVFVLPFEREAIFWWSYVFAIIAVVVQQYAMQNGWFNEETARSRFYKFPIIKVATGYMVIQLVLSFLFMIIDTVAVGWLALEIPAVIYVLLACGAAMGLIKMDYMRDTIEKMDEKLKVDVATMRALQSQTRAIAEQCDDEALRPALKALAEEMRYSDPMTGDALVQIENELKELVSELHRSVLDGDAVAAQHLCKKATLTLNERNRICKLNK